MLSLSRLRMDGWMDAEVAKVVFAVLRACKGVNAIGS